MTLLSALMQVALPIALLAWLWLTPADELLCYVTQAAAIGVALLAMAFVGLWLALPWWTPRFYGLVWAAAIGFELRRRRCTFTHLWPGRALEWMTLVLSCGLGAVGSYLTWSANQARQLPGAGVADISLPLGPGVYLVANGGSRKIVNAHLTTLDLSVPRFQRYRGQSYGLDLVKVDHLGFRAGGLRPSNPEAYEIYGEAVHAPCAGKVVASRDDRPDMPVPVMDLDVVEGNHVLLRCDSFDLLLAHFQPGSVRVETADHVVAGELLGHVGNSGKTTEPHLHISAQRQGTPDAPLSGEPLAVTINQRHLIRNDRVRRP